MKRVIILLIVSFGLMSFSINGGNGYPIPPKTNKLLFYIQRNHNSNTIIYDANFDKNGQLIPAKPISVYWIRYAENGQKMKLRYVEKMFAYGVKCKKIDATDFDVNLVADNSREFRLKLEAPFKAAIYTIINNRHALLDHMYIQADNSGFWPKVKYIELFGKDKTTMKDVYEKICKK